jgi:hypothetical protein
MMWMAMHDPGKLNAIMFTQPPLQKNIKLIDLYTRWFLPLQLLTASCILNAFLRLKQTAGGSWYTVLTCSAS